MISDRSGTEARLEGLTRFLFGPEERILFVLTQKLGKPIPHGKLAEHVHVPPPELDRLLATMREKGLAIETLPDRGHRLERFRALDADRLHAALGGPGRWRRLVLLSAVTSTNDVAAGLAEAREPDGTVVVAEAQTRGRGRGANTWISPPGSGLWCSLVLRPHLAPQSVPLLPLVAAVAAVHAAQRAAGAALRIKWPNDLVAAAGPAPDSRWLKVGGILAEGSTRGGGLDFAVLGIGINVTPLPAGVPQAIAQSAASLREVAPRACAREDLLAALLEELAPRISLLESEGIAPFLEELRALSILLGRAVRVTSGGRLIAGVARDLDAAGALLVETPGGAVERVVAGDAHLIEGR